MEEIAVSSKHKWSGLVAAKLIVALTISVCPYPALSQQDATSTAPPEVVIPEVLQIVTGTKSPLPIRVEPEGGAAKQSMLLIRGLPSTIVLSQGRLFESGVWAIKLANLAELSLTTSSDTRGQIELDLSLVNLDGTVLAVKHATLVFVPSLTSTDSKKLAQAVDSIVNSQEQEALQDPLFENKGGKALTDKERKSALLFMKRGDENMETGKVNIARLFYQRAADNGWSPGALALAKTYDGNELSKMTIIGGVQSDLALARKWYLRAQQLGSSEAGEKLQQLSQQ